MEAIPAPTAVYGTGPVHERKGGSQQNADAFRRALEEEGNPEGDRQSTKDKDQPMRRALQRRQAISRRDDGETLHIDVVA